MRFERPYSHQPGTPNTPGTPSNDHSGDDFSSPRASAVEQSRLSREMDNEFGELGTIDANGDMDDQMANQVLNSLNGGLWHGKYSIHIWEIRYGLKVYLYSHILQLCNP
ncbi:hypothetical protein BC936DRAFT_136862 [Jimgerdemannia flammicorona]|uniref:Uncharacterized protein n=1 Tax=Jimgerdemannia flammicorona TaxID=994334 RepID=A0A433CYM0_9FUNG|nr:hypothetical protein BC936DRAFT_136862 [Jimgerdemannia flammicorona]